MTVPGCSTCGLAVEWLRSCYSAEWNLFRDSDQTTRGRYYFSPEGTPFYPRVHNLGSSNWHDRNWQAEQGLGENLASTRSYDTGGLPSVAVRSKFVGSVDCIENGETIAEGVDAGTLINGFLASCVLPETPASLSYEEASDFASCSIQLAYARVIEWMYDANTVGIFDFLGSFLGPAYTLRWHPPTATLPSVTTAISLEASLAWVDGTANFQQFALQAAYSLIGPTPVGGFGTSLFWYTASQYVIDSLNADGANPDGDFFLCGHSYGGVAAMLTAARLRMPDAQRRIRTLTYGMPHIGDSVLAAILGTCQGYNLRNDNDIVTAIPPNLGQLFPVYVVIGDDALLTWPSWRKAPFGYLMNLAGTLTPDEEPLLDYPTVFAFATAAIADLPFPTIAGHAIRAYYDRIFTRCSAPEWPLDQADYDKITAGDVILMNDGTPMLMNDGTPILMNS